VPESLLVEVQRRRQWPTRMTQRLQVVVQNIVIRNVLQMQKQPRAPFLVKFLNWFPVLRRIPGRLISMGFRPEHVRTPEAAQ
jgi:hypothetical protein